MSEITGTIIANTILKLSFDENNPVSPMKLQKLVYCAYKKNLKTYEEKLFLEPFSKWKYGPVLESVYALYKSFGSSSITEYRWGNNQQLIVDLTQESHAGASIYDAWYRYKNLDAWDLSAKTHGVNTAWSKAKSYYLADEDIYNEPEF